MSAVPAEAPVEEAVRSRRAILLVVASRVLVVLAILVGAAVTVAARQQPAPLPDVVTVGSSDPTEDGAFRMATLVRAVEGAVAEAGGDLTELRVVALRTARARVTLRMVDPSTSPPDRIVTALRRRGLTDPEPTMIVPAAGGLRLDIAATAPLSTAPLPQLEEDAERSLASLLSDLVRRSGATLVRIVLPDEPTGPVRMEVAGTSGDVTALLGALEVSHTAPARFEQVLVRAAADRRTASIVFHERGPAPTAEPAE